MRIPVPRNRLVAFTLAGALLTAVVAAALVVPGALAQSGDQTDTAGIAGSDGSQQAADAPTPNQEFTPAVQTQSGQQGYEDDEHEGYEGEDEEYDEEE